MLEQNGKKTLQDILDLERDDVTGMAGMTPALADKLDGLPERAHRRRPRGRGRGAPAAPEAAAPEAAAPEAAAPEAAAPEPPAPEPPAA